MKPQLLILCLIASVSMFGAETNPLPYLDTSKPIDTRVDDLLLRLTLQEKGSLVYANSTFSVAGVPRLGIPELWMDDGPMGVREEVGVSFRNLNRTDDFATAMPATLGLAATFNTNLARAYGAVVGEEAKQRGKNIMLGPSLNIQRTPLCGRNFEYLGEDPFLTSRMAVNYIEGEQAQGVGSTAKHFAANNQENQRGSIDVEMDERTLREIYLPAFRASVQEAGVLNVMGSYNKFRGQHCCENDYLLNQVLKNQWGFKGLVMSDWAGVHNTGEAATNGMDMEMGTRTGPPFDTAYLAKPFLEGIESGKYPMSSLDDKVRRHLYVMFKLNLIHDPTETNSQSSNLNIQTLSTPEHQDTSRKIAEESIVLLKNKNLLPLDPAKIKSVAVIGANAVAKFASGGGSANIKAPYEITAWEGISNRLGHAVSITYSPGYSAPAGRGGGRRGAGAPVSVNTNLVTDAVGAARAADVVIFVGGLNHSLDLEGADRRDLKLPGEQDQLLQQIVRANPKTVVVLNGGGAVEMDDAWLSRVPSLLYAWYGGLEGGNALAHVLFGDVNPSGKLPCTFPKQLMDSPAHALNAYPGTNGMENYEEGLLVGYRWFDTRKIEPLFPFGYGLSYTIFKYSGLKIVSDQGAGNPTVTVEFTLANTGKREGAEVPQVYVEELHPNVKRPLKELKGFAKVSLKPGEQQQVSIRLDHGAFAHYDPNQNGWVADQGDYKIIVGSSSRDVELQGNCRLAETAFQSD